MIVELKRPGAVTRRASRLTRNCRQIGITARGEQDRRRQTLDAAKAKVSVFEAWRVLGLPGEPRRSCRSPFREDRHPSFSISQCGRFWYDHATGDHGDVVTFIQRAKVCSVPDAISLVRSLAGGVALPPVAAPNQGAGKAVAARYDGLRGLALTPPTLSEVIAIQIQRDWFTFAHLEIARMRGLLWMADVPHRGQTLRAWVFTDADLRSAQARRLDGQPWCGDEHTFKSKTLRSDPDAPPGLADVITANRKAVLLCEGEPDALCGLFLSWCAGIGEQVGVIALAGAGRALTPSVIERLNGRRCLIFRQTDIAGHKAALTWAEALFASGIAVQAANLDGLLRGDGVPAKDLADLCRRPVELETLERLSAELLGKLL